MRSRYTATRHVQLFEQRAGQGDNDENSDKDVDAAVGQDELDEGDAANSQELGHKGILGLLGNAGNLDGYGSCRSGITHDLGEQAAEKEDHEITGEEAGRFRHECVGKRGERVQTAEERHDYRADDGREDRVEPLNASQMNTARPTMIPIILSITKFPLSLFLRFLGAAGIACSCASARPFELD